MVRVCSVPHCRNRYNYVCPSPLKLSFHRFPKEATLRQKWIDVIQKADSSASFFVGNSTRICGAHFRSSDYWMAGSIRKLKKNTIPSIVSSKDLDISIKEEPTVVKEEICNDQNTEELEWDTTVIDKFEIKEENINEVTE